MPRSVSRRCRVRTLIPAADAFEDGTLPVLVTMLAGHFTYLVSHEQAWILLLCMMALGAFARHFYNLRHGGTTHLWMPLAAAVLVVVMFFLLKPDDTTPAGSSTPASASTSSTQASEEARSVFDANCAGCHALDAAGATGSVGPDLDAAAPDADLVRERVETV